MDEAEDPPDPQQEPGENDDADDDWADICDHCGAEIGDNPNALLMLVRDSSAIHIGHSERDGKRVVQACCPDHAAALRAEYAARPWRRRELWAGKVYWAIDQRGGTAKLPQICADTGLSPWQVHLGVLYHDWRLVCARHRIRVARLRAGIDRAG
ncbi:hypothetical protein [Kutzneria buriramensis]|uniref:Uncharacterized protein n=1 Tax=Kutzneria buriramensis TaxID=1045776 RepID=A0A3E0GW27_9PSEU|nr:hypothetical protein [Kutzneria buriramensis]REH31067.1 hypothetical protein BCF44_12290 [Kutzneria buriramensis]